MIRKYFDIQSPLKKMNGWERSLQELNRMMNGKTESIRESSTSTSHRKNKKSR